MRTDFGALVGRVLAVIGGLLVIGIVLRLLVAVLQPVLPPDLMQGLNAGWTMLLAIINPALGPIMAVLILAAICFVILGRRR
jgi:hypothetical protein